MLAVSDIVKQLDERPECQYYLKGTQNPLLQELLGADDLEARLMRRPLSTKGVITKQEWTRPSMSGPRRRIWRASRMVMRIPSHPL